MMLSKFCWCKAILTVNAVYAIINKYICSLYYNFFTDICNFEMNINLSYVICSYFHLCFRFLCCSGCHRKHQWHYYNRANKLYFCSLQIKLWLFFLWNQSLFLWPNEQLSGEYQIYIIQISCIYLEVSLLLNLTIQSIAIT